MMTHNDSSNVHAGVTAAVLTAVSDFSHSALFQVLLSMVIGVLVGQVNRIINAKFARRDRPEND